MDTIKILIKTLHQQDQFVEASPNMTIRQLKIRLEEKTKIPINSQKLIFGGRALKDTSTILGCSIKDGNAIHLVEKTTFPINRTRQQPQQSSSRNINELLGNLNREPNSFQDRLNSDDSGESHGFIMGILPQQIGIGQLLQSISRIIHENPPSSSSGNGGNDNVSDNSNNNNSNNNNNNINNNSNNRNGNENDGDDDDDDDDDDDLDNRNFDRLFEIRRRRREFLEQINSNSNRLNRNSNRRINIINQRNGSLNNNLNSIRNINSLNTNKRNKKNFTNEDFNRKLDRVDKLLNTIEGQLTQKKSENEIKVKERKKKRRVNKSGASQEKEIKKREKIKNKMEWENKKKGMKKEKEKKNQGMEKREEKGGKIEEEREIIEEEEERNKHSLIKLKKGITKIGNTKKGEEIENKEKEEKGREGKRKRREREIKRKRKKKKEISTELQIMKLVESFKRMKNSIEGLDLILKRFPKILNGKINSQKKQSELKQISVFLKAFGYVLLHLSITTNTLQIEDNQIMIEPSRLGEKINEKKSNHNQNITPDPNRKNNRNIQNESNYEDSRNNTNIESNENNRNQSNEPNQNQSPTQIIRQEFTFPHDITIGQTQVGYSGREGNGNRNVNRNESNSSPGILNFISSLSRLINNSIQERTQNTNEEPHEERKDELPENINEKEDKD
ncbi:large proline-rich protein bag6 [Anaeramoeba flamelloides]|uniref:Large proline-rich protein bag6 n=1 Tax=Anaeramoeba flamelloides TaxID=1746091 RepID=A0AAV7ZEU6_9EUKA|nr:large proline-rich protein bag6 [Anaeramoeba flamelloides]